MVLNSTAVITSRRVTLLNDPYLNDLNNLLWTTGQDNRGFQYQIALDVLPAGVTSDMIQQGQTWFVENTSTAYRLSLYVGEISVSTINGITVSGQPTIGQALTAISISGATWTTISGLPGPTVSGYILALSGTTPTWTVQYPIGTVGQVLTLSGTAPSPQWMTPTVSPGVPTGTLLDFAGPAVNVPTGYLICDGASYSTTTYSSLFAAIAYTWGGSGATFNVPDLRGKVTIGVSGTAYPLAALGGEFLHVLSSGETPLNVHTHIFTVPSSTGTTSTGTSSSVSLSIPGSTYNTVSNTTGITVSTSPTSLTAAGTTASSTTGVTDVTPASQVGSTYGVVTAGTGLGYQGRLYVNGTGANITDTITDPGHTHTVSLSVTGTINSSVSDPGHVPSIPTMTVTGSVAIPGLNFTVPAQTGLTTSGNTATTASGHNNMQPYATVYKIIKT